MDTTCLARPRTLQQGWSWKGIFPPLSSGLVFLCLMATGVLTFCLMSHTWMEFQVSTAFTFIREDAGLFSLQRHVLSAGGVNGEYSQWFLLRFSDLRQHNCADNRTNGTATGSTVPIPNACVLTWLLFGSGIATAVFVAASCLGFLISFWYLKSALSMRDVIAPHTEPFRPMLSRIEEELQLEDVRNQVLTPSVVRSKNYLGRVNLSLFQKEATPGNVFTISANDCNVCGHNGEIRFDEAFTEAPYKALVNQQDFVGERQSRQWPIFRLETLNPSMANKAFSLGHNSIECSSFALRIVTLLLAAVIALWVAVWSYVVRHPQDLLFFMDVPVEYLNSALPLQCRPSVAFYALVMLFLMVLPCAVAGKSWLYEYECWSLSPSVVPALTGTLDICPPPGLSTELFTPLTLETGRPAASASQNV